MLQLRLTPSQALDNYSAGTTLKIVKQGTTAPAPVLSNFMASISTAENDDPILADDEWEGFKSDGEAGPKEREDHESDDEPEHVWEDTNTETDIPEDTNSHGIGASRWLGVFFKNKDGTRADLNVNPEPGSLAIIYHFS